MPNIIFRVTEAEKADITARATAKGMTVTQYIKERIYSNDTHTGNDGAVTQPVYTEARAVKRKTNTCKLGRTASSFCRLGMCSCEEEDAIGTILHG